MTIGDHSQNNSVGFGNVQPYVCPKCNGYKEDTMYRLPCKTCNGQGVVFGSSWIPSDLTVAASVTVPQEEIYTITKKNLNKLLDSIKDYKTWNAVVQSFPALHNADGSIRVPDRFVIKADSDEPEVEEIRYHNCWDCRCTRDECFNKLFPPKDLEGRDCDRWK